MTVVNYVEVQAFAIPIAEVCGYRHHQVVLQIRSDQLQLHADEYRVTIMSAMTSAFGALEIVRSRTTQPLLAESGIKGITMSGRNIPTTIALTIAACWTCSSVDVMAQSRLGSNGPLSQPAGGGGSGGTGGSQSGLAGFGQSGLAGFGQNGLSGFGQSGSSNSSGASGGFIGRGDNAGRFVGNANAGQQTVTGGGRNAGGANGLNSLGGGRGGNFSSNPFGQFGLGNGFNSLGNTPQGKQRKAVKPQQKIAFDYTPLPTPRVTATLTSRYQRLSKREAFSGVEVEVVNGVATLRGNVLKANDAKLAVILAKLEPGVRSVVSEIAVSEPAVPTTDGDDAATNTPSSTDAATATPPSTDASPSAP